MRKQALIIILLCGSVLGTLSVRAKTEQEYQQEIQTLKQRNNELDKRLEEVSSALKQSDVTIRMLKEQLAQATSDTDGRAEELKETQAALKQVKDQLKALLAQQSDSDVKQQEMQLAAALQRVQQLEKELKDAKAELKKQNKTVEELQRAQGASSQADVEQLQSDLKDARANIETLKAQLLAAIAKSGGETETRINDLETKLADANAKLLLAAKEKATLDARLKQMQPQQDLVALKDAEIARLEGELRKATDYISTNTANLSAVAKSRAGLEGQLTELKLAKGDLEGQVAKVEAEKKNVEAQLQQMTAAKVELENQLIETTSSKTGLESRLTKALEDRAIRIAQLESDVKRLQTTLDTAQAAIREAERKSAETNQTAQAAVQEAERKYAEAAKTIQELEARLLNQSSVPEAAKARIQEITDELAEVKSQLDTQNRIQQDYPVVQQELASCKGQVTDLTKMQEQCRALEGKFSAQSFALEQAKKELAAVTEVNLQLKGGVDKEITQRQSQEKIYQETITRNRDLEQQYAEGKKALELKEQVLQDTLTQKALLEKKIDEIDASFEALRAKLAQAEAQNATLQTQLADTQKMRPMQQDTTSAQAALQQQVMQERTLRQKIETDLATTRQQLLALQQQTGTRSPQQITVATSPVGLGDRSVMNSLQALFPRDLLPSTPGATVALLGWSPDKTKITYQESANQTERLWLLQTPTRQVSRLLEWQRGAGSTASLSRVLWAYDNEHFVFATGTPGKYSLYVGNSRGMIGKPVSITDEAVHCDWSPNQLQFAYFSGANLMIQDLKGGMLPVQVGQTARGASGTSLQWSPDGSTLALSMKREASFDIFTLTFSGNKPTLQTLVASPSDDIQPSWSPDGRNIAFFVRSKQYDTKLAISPVDRSRAPYVVAHNVSLPATNGTQWLTASELLYVGEEQLATVQNTLYTVDITNGKRSAAPMSIVFAR